MMNWKEWGRQRSWHNVVFYPVIYLERLRKVNENHIYFGRLPCVDVQGCHVCWMKRGHFVITVHFLDTAGVYVGNSSHSILLRYCMPYAFSSEPIQKKSGKSRDKATNIPDHISFLLKPETTIADRRKEMVKGIRQYNVSLWRQATTDICPPYARQATILDLDLIVEI